MVQVLYVAPVPTIIKIINYTYLTIDWGYIKNRVIMA